MIQFETDISEFEEDKAIPSDRKGPNSNNTEQHNYDSSSSQSHRSPPFVTVSNATITTIPILTKHMNTDTILYDITLGFIFAALFTFVVAITGWFLNYCCVCIFCPRLHRKRMKRKRMRERKQWIVRERAFAPGIQLIPLTAQDYNEISTEDHDEQEEQEVQEIRETTTRMEYGEPDTEGYDDEDDYEIGADTKEKGRYEDTEVRHAAAKFFGEDEKQEEQQPPLIKRDDDSHSSDSSNESVEPLLDLATMELDLALMEKKIVDSMESAKFV